MRDGPASPETPAPTLKNPKRTIRGLPPMTMPAPLYRMHYAAPTSPAPVAVPPPAPAPVIVMSKPMPMPVPPPVAAPEEKAAA